MATFWSASGPVCAGETSYGRLRPGSIFSHRPLPWRGPASAPRPLKEACPLAFWPVACSALGLHLGPCAFSACCVSALQTHAACPGRDLDFMPANLSGSADRPIMAGPLKCEKMVLWLRGLLLRHWRQRSDAPPPPRLLSLRRILLNARCSRGGVNWELRRIQGHHRASGSDKSVGLYSRDDVVPMLRLQRQIVTSVRSGFRPLQPVARGLLPSPWSVPDHFLLSPDCLPEASPLPAAVLPPPAAGPSPPLVEEDLCSLSSESTDSDSGGRCGTRAHPR